LPPHPRVFRQTLPVQETLISAVISAYFMGLLWIPLESLILIGKDQDDIGQPGIGAVRAASQAGLE